MHPISFLNPGMWIHYPPYLRHIHSYLFSAIIQLNDDGHTAMTVACHQIAHLERMFWWRFEEVLHTLLVAHIVYIVENFGELFF